MAIRKNADGSVTVGIIPEPKEKKENSSPEVEKKQPKKKAAK